MRALALLATVTLLAGGCTLTYREVGVPVPDPDGLVVGVSTTADALRSLGPPRLVRRQFDGDLYTWRRTHTRERSLTLFPVYVRAFFYADADSRRDELALLFDHEGVLRGVGLRRETEED